MALSKNPKFDLKRKFRRITEIGLILSMGLVIVAFKYFPQFQSEKKEVKVEKEQVIITDVPVTDHKQPEVPPKTPLAPIYEPSDDILVDIDINFDEFDESTIIDEVPPQIIEDEEEDSFDFFEAVETQPQIIGGLEAVLANLEYPEIAKRAGIEGVVVVYAYLDKTGNIVKCELAKDIGAGCGEAALKAVSKVKFIPGKQRGKAVRCKVSVPVRFRLR